MQRAEHIKADGALPVDGQPADVTKRDHPDDDGSCWSGPSDAKRLRLRFKQPCMHYPMIPAGGAHSEISDSSHSMVRHTDSQHTVGPANELANDLQATTMGRETNIVSVPCSGQSSEVALGRKRALVFTPGPKLARKLNLL